ncbi:YciI family protein [Oleiharenicola sp. Vm1]|uniref:YciI family protein n=1 Tax=Oleiharenicola sp. Vm1 TaxID=3398393 RepID=UPI0039F64684
MSTPSQPISRYMLLFRNAGPEAHAHLTPEGRALLARQWNDWYDGLAAQRKVSHGQPLALDGRVVSGPEGRVTDGPFAEAKEVVGGYIMLTVESLDEATAIARQCPGLPHGLTVEVRPLAAVSPVLAEVRGRPPQA